MAAILRRPPLAVAAIVALWVAGLASVVFLPDALNRWVLPKDLALAVACLFAALAPRSGRLPRWLLVIAAIGAVVMVFAAAGGAAPLAQLMGRWPRYEGAITLSAYFAAAWLGARLLGGGTAPDRRSAFIRAISVAAIAVGLLSIFEAVGLRPIPSDLERPGSLLGNATNQGIAGLMFAALLFLPMVRSLRSRTGYDGWLFGVGFALAVATTVLSASRAAIAASFVVLLVFGVGWILTRPRASRWRAAALVAAAAGGFVILALIVPFTRDRVLGTSPFAVSSVLDRFAIWNESLAVLASHPLLGVGPSGFLDAVALRQNVDGASTLAADARIDSPHNLLLQAATAGGIPLLVCAVALFVGLVFVGVRALRSRGLAPEHQDELVGAGLALLGFSLALLTHFTAPATTLLAAVLLGTIVAVPAGRERIPVIWTRTAVVAAWVAILAVTTTAEVTLRSAVDSMSAGRYSVADEQFSLAQAARPWDADIPLIAAQEFAAASVAGQADAPPYAVRWGTASRLALPQSLSAGEALAIGQQYSGDLSGAAGTLEQLRARAPGNAQILHRLGGVRFLLGDTPKAIELLVAAAALDPNNVEIWKTLEYVYRQSGDVADADGTLQQIAKLTG